MTQNTWQRMQSVFDAVVDLPAPERQRVLDEQCGSDPSLRRLVESLLHCEGGNQAQDAVHAALKSAAATVESSEIPNFRVLRRLGEGGMGIVYEAEQLQPRRRVALKLIRAGQFASDRERRLFEREAEALARLVHPGIAAIYESGQSVSGQPYLVMEFVEGSTLTSHVNSLPSLPTLKRQDVCARIELFLEICDAVSYAHQRGVIHRDLKPANIMVSHGRAKVLDFGLARVETGLDFTRTETGVVQGSLRYMSPEQARGESSRIDTRSDLYSLGIVLYELLAGAHPYLDRTDLLGAVGQICDAPMRSLRIAKKPFSQDLETILSKALAKDPGQRYEGVASLAADLRRFLSDETILARPATLRYQLGKLILRNKLAFSAIATIVLLIAGFAVFSFQQSLRIARERDRANQEAATANQVSGFLVRLFSETNPTVTNGELTARELLQAGRKRLETELRDQPEIRARLLENIGHAFNVVGPQEDAIRAFEEAIQLRGPNHPLSAEIWSGLGDSYYNMGKYADSVRTARIALEIRQKHLPPSSQEISNEMNGLALSLAAKGDLDEAARFFALLEQRDKQYANLGAYQEGEHLAGYGAVLRRQKKYDQAIEKLQRGVQLLRKIPKKANKLRAFNDLGLTLNQTQRYAEADAIFGEMLSQLPSIYGPDHPNVAIVELNRINSWNGLKRYGESLSTLKRITPLLVAALPEAHPTRCDLLGAKAAATAGMGDTAAAKRLYEQAIEFCRTRVGPNHPNTLGLIADRNKRLQLK